MTRIPCPKCNSQAYDDNSIFCHKCGTQLSPVTPERLAGPEKKMSLSQSNKTLLPRRKTTFVRDDSLKPQKPAPVQPSRPVSGELSSLKPPSPLVRHSGPIEICARCGGLVLNKNRVFCENCGVNIREELVGDISIQKDPVLKHGVQAPVVHQDTETKILKEQEPFQFQGAGTRFNPKVRRVIIILSGIAIIIIMLVLVFMFIVSFWVSLS